MNSITVRKGNVELHVPEDEKERYLKLGYSVYNGDNLVEEALTEDVSVLLTKINTLETENERLKKENSKLKNDLKNDLKKEKAKTKTETN